MDLAGEDRKGGHDTAGGARTAASWQSVSLIRRVPKTLTQSHTLACTHTVSSHNKSVTESELGLIESVNDIVLMLRLGVEGEDELTVTGLTASRPWP